MFYSHGTNHSCGVLVLVRDDLEIEVKSSEMDNNGRVILIDAAVQGSDFLLVNIYAPNKVQEQCTYFSDLNKLLEKHQNTVEQKLILGGDWNVAFDMDLDCSGGKPIKKDSTNRIDDMCLNFELVDIWRIRNPDQKRFTWRQKSPFIQRRLDYWLISDIYQEEVESTDIIPSIKSHHSAIILHLNSIEKQKHGPSYWKFNASLLDDSEFKMLINQKIPECCEEFKEVNDKRVLWDLIKYRIRQVAMKYGKEKARARREKISNVEGLLKQCEDECSTNPSPENKERLEVLKNEYNSLYEHLSMGAIIRSRATWYEFGEKSNKYFLNLETHKKNKSSVRKVFTKDGFLTSDPRKIMNEVERFYSDLYKLEPISPSENVANSFVTNVGMPKLSDEETLSCEGKLTVSECLKSLQSFQTNKAPGNDGLTVEFYTAFWDTLGVLLVDSLNYSYEYGELSNTQKQAIITLLEKKDKDKRKINNWRPISLINVDVKIGSKAIAQRLQNILPSIIHQNQNAYVKGRTIFDAIRTVDDVLEYTERYGINGQMIAIDFTKAFDSVNRDFLYKTLSAFNFGPSIIQWVQTFYKNISSCVLNNGFSTGHFQIQRGVRQGDPLSSYLFIIVLEILAINIRGNEEIQGILVDNEEIKIEIFADDLTGFLRNSQSLAKFVEITEEFGKCSGLPINYEKTEILLLGNNNPTLAHDIEIGKIKVKKAIRILGVHFTYDKILRQKLNFAEIIDAIKGKLKLWRWRNLTIIGRIQIVKTFIIPVIMYRAGLISLDREVIKEANSIIFDFIWKGKDKVKRSSLISDIENGGLKAPHLESIIKTQRILCCKKFANDNPSSWKIFLSHYLKPVGYKFILCCDFDMKKLPISLPKYYKECFECFAECSAARQTNISDLSHEEISNTVIWNNKFICINGKSIFNTKLLSKGIIRIGDLITKKNRLISKCNLIELDFSPVDVFGLVALIDAIPQKWRQSLKIYGYVDKPVFVLQNQIQLKLKDHQITIGKAVSKGIYAELRSRISTTPTAQMRYTTIFENEKLEWKEIYKLPFKVALDIKSREFQYRILNRYLATNTLLKKIGKSDSSACSFCKFTDESLEHLFITCPIIETLWNTLINWCNERRINIASLSDIDKLFGICSRKSDFLLLNHIIIITKQYIYYCRNNALKPFFNVLLLRIQSVYNLESFIAKSKDKLVVHSAKWSKYVNI